MKWEDETRLMRVIRDWQLANQRRRLFLRLRWLLEHRAYQ